MELKTIRLSHIDAAKVIADVKKIVPDWNETLPITRRLAYDEGDFTTETITDPDSGETYQIKHYTREPELQLVPLVQGEEGWIDAHHSHVSGARIDISNAGQRQIGEMTAGEFRVDVTFPAVFERQPFRLVCQSTPESPDRNYSIPDQETPQIVPTTDWTIAQIKSWMDVRGVPYSGSDTKAVLLDKVVYFLVVGLPEIEWKAGVWLNVDDIVSHGGIRYKAIQSHFTQSDWPPQSVPALFALAPAGEWPDWVQPLGAHDAYPIGAKVTHNGQRWISSVAANVWAPGVYGWTMQ